MSVKGLLLDLDDTLYEYEPNHQLALEATFDYVAKTHGLSIDVIKGTFSCAKSKLKLMLPTVAANHSRILYFQLMYESLGISIFPNALRTSEIYWSTFIENMELTDDAKDFLERSRDLDICLVTDLTAEIQYRKVEKLGIQKYISSMVSSEEAGLEKPHPFIFKLGLAKLKLNSEDVVMVGDNYKKDIIGASNLGIKSFWLNRGGKSDFQMVDNSTAIKSLRDIKLC